MNPNRLLFVIFFSALLCNSQNETSKWYFGQTAGLSFLTTPPTVITSAMTTQEGCSSIADAAGNTLLYTDGSTVYNQQNLVMANGTGLFGNSSTTQSGVIVKQPGNANIYYVFSLGASGTGSLCFSTVDMTLAAGLGSVTAKNAYLYSPMTEKLTSVRHCNGIDTWVISHESNNNNFRCYLVTSAGVNPVPVISSVGSIHTGFIGYLKVSPNGKKLGMGIYGISNFEIYDFDPSTGIVSNQLILANLSSPYGCEFSPDGTKFYGTREGAFYVLYQWDLCAGSNTAIIASQYTIATTPGVILYAMQTAPDGKIYVSRYTTQMLGIINNPNVAGAGCNYVDLGQSTAPGTCRLGLPNFITSFFNPPTLPFLSSVVVCQSNASFSASAVVTAASCNSSGNPVTNFLWNFGDPNSGPANTSTLSNPAHAYTAAGTYTAQLVLNYACRSDTLRQLVSISNIAPTFSVSGKLSICKKQTTTLTAVGSASQGVVSYTWFPVTSLNASVSVSPTITTVYTVIGKDLNGCTTTHTVQVIVSPCAGIAEQNMDVIANIYPNPTDGKFILETTLEKFTYKIYNQLGMLIDNGLGETSSQTIDIKNLPNGIYFVELNSTEKLKMLKLVKGD